MGFTDAAHAESYPYALRLFITPLSCSLVGKTMEVAVKPGSRAAHPPVSSLTLTCQTAAVNGSNYIGLERPLSPPIDTMTCLYAFY